MISIGLALLEICPKCSQDLNPIESVWQLLRDKLDETVPTSAEPREAFVPRLRQPAPCVASTWWPQQNKTLSSPTSARTTHKDSAYMDSPIWWDPGFPFRKEKLSLCLVIQPVGSGQCWVAVAMFHFWM